jgi:hypothetical protein
MAHVVPAEVLDGGVCERRVEPPSSDPGKLLSFAETLVITAGATPFSDGF